MTDIVAPGRCKRREQQRVSKSLKTSTKAAKQLSSSPDFALHLEFVIQKLWHRRKDGAV
jgi:hypothetical protein